MTFRKLLATTAMVAVTATGAYVVTPSPYAAAATMASGYVQQIDTTDHYASDIIGSTVYSSAEADGEAIGDVNDLVVAPDGGIAAVVIGVGGFLGIGEKDVAVPFDRLTWRTDEDGETWPVLAATQEELESAPAFERDAQTAMAKDPAMKDNAPADTMAKTDGPAVMDENAPADTMAKTDDPAVMDGNAPADTVARTNDPAVMDETAMAPADGATFDPSTISVENLIDTTVYSSDGENVGEVSDVLLAEGGEIDAVVIDVGGFLGIGEKPVAIGYSDLAITMDQNENLILKTAFTRDQLDAAPEYDETAYREDRQKVLVRGKS
ncbi:PRC-barrel domain-containing protein [Bauldia litoralis]|uniref:PRC-barrel domain-containing protein n=1 Tax=Bauldia litoralis TaxID=665467 RepID=A0A1G6B5L0_9HYPH|nr:PRC-barrel domain-containing protein [Bauldia litoralis]SDB15703.1 PRC-barrel domain-containing protein [Bauldia litoralis]